MFLVINISLGLYTHSIPCVKTKYGSFEKKYPHKRNSNLVPEDVYDYPHATWLCDIWLPVNKPVNNVGHGENREQATGGKVHHHGAHGGGEQVCDGP